MLRSIPSKSMTIKYPMDMNVVQIQNGKIEEDYTADLYYPIRKIGYIVEDDEVVLWLPFSIICMKKDAFKEVVETVERVFHTDEMVQAKSYITDIGEIGGMKHPIIFHVSGSEDMEVMLPDVDNYVPRIYTISVQICRDWEEQKEKPAKYVMVTYTYENAIGKEVSVKYELCRQANEMIKKYIIEGRIEKSWKIPE